MLPTNDEMNLVDSLRSQYSTLKETHNTQRPSNFWDQMDVLNNRIKALEPNLKETIKLIGDAASKKFFWNTQTNVSNQRLKNT